MDRNKSKDLKKAVEFSDADGQPKVSPKEEDFSSIDPSLIKDLMKSEGSGDTRNEPENPRSNSEREGDYLSNEDIEQEDEVEKFNKVPELIDRNEVHSPPMMERISEENEDEKHMTSFDKFNEEMFRDDFKLTKENIDEILKSDISAGNLKNYIHPVLYNSEQSKYQFKPVINKKSKKLAEELHRNKTSGYLSSNSKQSKSPVELELYKDAIKRKEKMDKIEYNHMMEILLKASRNKMSSKSHKIAINKVEKIIEEAVKKYEKESKKLSLINIGEILTELKVFREIFRTSETLNNKGQQKRYQNYKDIKLEIGGVKEAQKRKRAEVDFYEQLWIILNPDNNEFVRTDILCEMLKILFSPVAGSTREIAAVLRQFLMAAFFLSTNPEQKRTFVSPIDEREMTEEEIWPLEKLVKEFLFLKENLLAYQSIGNTSKKLQEELEKEKKERLKFKPTVKASRDELAAKSKFFQERLPALIDREKLRKQVLEEMKKENEQNALKECTFKPAINKPKIYKDDQSDKMLEEEPVYDKLYSMHKDQKKRLQKEKEERSKMEVNKELEGCTFKPELMASKSFEKSISSTNRPKNFNQVVDRMRRGILENLKKKYMIKKIPVGENWERVRKANIKPFNITDLNKKKEPKLEKKEDNKDDYFSIEITIPSGKVRNLRVHKDDDPLEIAGDFCKVYGMKDEIRDRLAETIHQFMSMYLSKELEPNPNETGQYQQVQFHNLSKNNLNVDDL